MSRPVAAVRSVAVRARGRLERERERRYLVALGFLIVDRGRQAAASVLAGALAFRFFLTVLPLTLVLVVALGYEKSAGGAPSAALEQFGIKGVLATTIDHSASFSDPGRTAVLLLGLFGVFQGSRTTVAALRAIHALAWGMPVVRWPHRGPATVIFLAGLIIGVALAGLVTRLRAEAGVALGFAGALALAVAYCVLWVGASRLLPHREDVGWTALVPGAVLVGGGFALLQLVTANWIGPKLEHSTALYGSLGVAFVVLGWLYAVARLAVAAPLLNVAVLQHREARVPGAIAGVAPGGSTADPAGVAEPAGGKATARPGP